MKKTRNGKRAKTKNGKKRSGSQPEKLNVLLFLFYDNHAAVFALFCRAMS